jgi:acyl carrier protein
MVRNEIIEKLDDIIDQVVNGVFPATDDLSSSEKLGIILGESLQSMYFVTTVEDEFNIVFDDDEIDLSFFQNVESIADKIECHLIEK